MFFSPPFKIEQHNSSSGIKFPTVTVSTKSKNGNVEIMVADNGNGIPLHILDKIFQPFYTKNLPAKEQVLDYH